MGYSCRTDAMRTLERLQTAHRVEDSNNVFQVPPSAHKYFWEIGQENADGRITGRVFQFVDTDTDTVIPAGRFCISPDGRVIRFPGIPRKFWTVRSDLWLCSDCTMVSCNGAEGAEIEDLEAVHKGLAELGTHLAPNFDSETEEGLYSFSARPCDLCKTELAGYRARFSILGN